MYSKHVRVVYTHYSGHCIYVYVAELFVPHNTVCIRGIHIMYNRFLLSLLVYFTAPTCFNQTGCEVDAVGNHSISFIECCFELSAVSYASPGQCLLCPKTGKL